MQKKNDRLWGMILGVLLLALWGVVGCSQDDEEACTDGNVSCDREASVSLSVAPANVFMGVPTTYTIGSAVFDELQWYVDGIPQGQCSGAENCIIAFDYPGVHEVRVEASVDAAGGVAGVGGSGESTQSASTTVQVDQFSSAMSFTSAPHEVWKSLPATFSIATEHTPTAIIWDTNGVSLAHCTGATSCQITFPRRGHYNIMARAHFMTPGGSGAAAEVIEEVHIATHVKTSHLPTIAGNYVMNAVVLSSIEEPFTFTVSQNLDWTMTITYDAANPRSGNVTINNNTDGVVGHAHLVSDNPLTVDVINLTGVDCQSEVVIHLNGTQLKTFGGCFFGSSRWTKQ